MPAPATLVVLISSVTFTSTIFIYIWSKDPGRRRRAWRVLKLLLRD